MADHDRVDVYYPIWIQLISYPGLPLLSLVAVWLLTQPLLSERLDWSFVIACVALGAPVLYQCAMGWRALRYMRVRMTATLQYLEVISGGQKRTIFWSEFALPKDYAFAQTTHLFLRTGETVVYAFDNMTNIGLVKALIREHHDGSR